MSEVSISTIVQYEQREIEIDPEGFASGFESRSYRLGIAASPGGADIVSINFGTEQWSAERGTWLIPIPTADTSKIPPGDVYVGVWEIGVPQPMEPIHKLTAGRVPGRPLT
jgi:hypothetical protein